MFVSKRYGSIERNCHFCICQTCGALRCPSVSSSAYNPLFKNHEFRRCIGCISRDNIHIVDCESYQQKPLRRFLVVRRVKAKATLVHRVSEIEERLGEILELLK